MAIFSFRLRISSMPRLEAASISTTSKELPSSMPRQEKHSPQGSPRALNFSSVARFSQFRSLAINRAVVVLPVPRGP